MPEPILGGIEPAEISKPEPDDARFWSVTTIIGVLDKPALIHWSAAETAKAAVYEFGQWRGMAQENKERAVDWLKRARFRAGEGERSATELGTAVHKAHEQWVTSGIRPEVDDEVAPYMLQLERWLDLFTPSYEAAELTVYNPEFGYAGTADGFLTIDGVRFIFDIKTSKKSVDAKGKPTSPYPEVALQLAAYRHATHAAIWRARRFENFRRRYYLLSEEEKAAAVDVPEVDTGLCIHITPEHCVAYPIRCGPDVFDSFLYCQEVARWTFEASKTAIGQPLEPDPR